MTEQLDTLTLEKRKQTRDTSNNQVKLRKRLVIGDIHGHI